MRLGRSADRAYGDGTVTVPDFNIACSPARLVVRLASGRSLTLRLHTVDAIRQTPRAAGLDDEPRLTQGMIEAPASVLGSTDPEVKAFVAKVLTGGRYTQATIDATRDALAFREQGWTLRAGGCRNARS